MAEYLTRFEDNGTINIAEDVVAAIVADAVKQVEGVGAMSQNVTEQLSARRLCAACAWRRWRTPSSSTSI